MIARLCFKLPYTIAVPSTQTFESLSRAEDDLTIVIHPLQQLNRMDVLTGPILETPPKASSRLRYNNEAVFEMDVLIVDIIRSDFDRARTGQTTNQSVVQMGYKFANEFLSMLRNATQNPDIRSIEGEVFLAFIDEQGNLLPEEEGKYRFLAVDGLKEIRNTVVDLAHWNALRTENFEDHLHRTLMLEAKAIFPEAASVVLAYSALESAIKLVIQQLAVKSLPEDVAKWVVKNARKESSLRTLLNGAVAALSGTHLLEDASFSGKFTKLSDLRNAVVHRGKLELEGNPVTRLELNQALDHCTQLITQVEALSSIGPLRQPLTGGFEIKFPLLTWGAGEIHIRTKSPDTEEGT